MVGGIFLHHSRGLRQHGQQVAEVCLAMDHGNCAGGGSRRAKSWNLVLVHTTEAGFEVTTSKTARWLSVVTTASTCQVCVESPRSSSPRFT